MNSSLLENIILVAGWFVAILAIILLIVVIIKSLKDSISKKLPSEKREQSRTFSLKIIGVLLLAPIFLFLAFLIGLMTVCALPFSSCAL